ncbi:hypothetical protein [Paraburkholderia youngii]|uniref:hypothetical protein n=1 Tax=Paraburkholderia youngii TaxID=2782701 RepID=UPI0020D019DA|nr:hypothetical protein [Paraburkholderia youngii]
MHRSGAPLHHGPRRHPDSPKAGSITRRRIRLRSAQRAAREYAARSFADWSKWIALAVQREAEWFDEANRACAAWSAWWQAAYGIAPGVAPLAGGLSAWWWSSQNALPFAGVV